MNSKLLALGLVGLLWLGLAAPGMAQGVAPAQGGMAPERYANTAFGWSISYPAGWTVDASTPEFVRISRPGMALVGVRSVCNSDGRTLNLDEVTDQLLGGMEQSVQRAGQTFGIVTRGSISLAGNIPARDTIIELGPGGRSRIVSALVGNCLFMVNAETYAPMWAQVEGDFDEMIRSWSFP
jgi:hypothetical protein